MTVPKRLELTGLRGDHPLGFLAACGLLHSCKQSMELGQTKLAWKRSQESRMFVASLHTEKPFNIACLTRIINLRCRVVRESPAFKWSSKIDDRQKYREEVHKLLVQDNVSQENADVLAIFAALASDLATTKKGTLQSSLMDLTSGNQHFLKSIRTLAGQPKGKKKQDPEEFTEDAVREALFGPWQYLDDYHSMGWDPQTQRLHPLRNKAPTNEETNASVRAAVFLATQALPLFPCFVRGGRLYTTGFYREGNEDWFSWPIWSMPITIDILRSLLAHPFRPALKRRGVEIVYRCRRASTGGEKGDYRVFSNASVRSWSRSQGAG